MRDDDRGDRSFLRFRGHADLAAFGQILLLFRFQSDLSLSSECMRQESNAGRNASHDSSTLLVQLVGVGSVTSCCKPHKEAVCVVPSKVQRQANRILNGRPERTGCFWALLA